MNNSFLTYSSEELALEPSFIKWVREGSVDAAWNSFYENHNHFQPVVDEAKNLVTKVTITPIYMEQSKKDALWERIQSNITEDHFQTRKILWYKWIGVAACLAILLGVVYFKWNRPTIYSLKGNHEMVHLPDDSEVIINAESSIAFIRNSFANKRNINLEGEAFFNVVKNDAPFRVIMDKGIIEVLGTSFNAYSRNDSMAVQCFTGSVRVLIKSEEFVLKAGEQLSYSGLKESYEKINLPFQDSRPRWISRIFHFERSQLRIVLDELSRQYDVQIVLDNEKNDKELYTGFFTGDDLDKALQSVLWPMNMNYRISGDIIYVNDD